MRCLVLEARHLVKRYFGVTVVDKVSFTFGPGEILGYLGPNGSGKTTTVRMLAGLLEPSGGSVWDRGSDVGTDSSSKVFWYCSIARSYSPEKWNGSAAFFVDDE